MKYGTSHFDTFDAAVQYYRPYGFDRVDVDFKIASGEISIGKPAIKQGQRLMLSTSGRYHIEEVQS